MTPLRLVYLALVIVGAIRAVDLFLMAWFAEHGWALGPMIVRVGNVNDGTTSAPGLRPDHRRSRAYGSGAAGRGFPGRRPVGSLLVIPATFGHRV